MSRLERLWYGRDPLAFALAPLGFLYCTVARLRRAAYGLGLIGSRRLPVPVIVVGNITVGGTGKTPLTIALAQQLAARGYRPGIVSRGYGGTAERWPQQVGADSDPARVGDEPVLIARRTGLPMAVGPDRVAAARLLLDDIDILLTDDGLQHYRLARDVEVAVVDGARGLGNRRCLPAGPLREPPARLTACDAVVVTGGGGIDGVRLAGDTLVRLGDGEREPLTRWRGRRVHAVAGIGNPARFFETLSSAGLEVLEHPFPDHHRFAAGDLDFADGLPVLMTEKDAVKCGSLAVNNVWVLPVDAQLPPDLLDRLLTKIRKRHG